MFARTRSIFQKHGAKIAAVFSLGLVTTQASAVVAFTVLPASAATAVDGLVGIGADIGVLLFAIGLPVLLAVIGWNVTRGGAKKAARL